MILRLSPRLFDKIAPCPLTGCWLFVGSQWGRDHKVPGGAYGQVREGERRRPAHVVIYEQLIGPVPAGLVLDHLCRMRLCVNPDHLEPVTHAENAKRGLNGRLRPHRSVQRRAPSSTARAILNQRGVA